MRMQQPDVFLRQKLVIEPSEQHENQTESNMTHAGKGWNEQEQWRTL
jgi:hypothetical protein